MENVFKASCPQPQSPAATKLKSESLTFSALTGNKTSKDARNKTDAPTYSNEINLSLAEIVPMKNVTFPFFIQLYILALMSKA
jgi:hypothetical protein